MTIMCKSYKIFIASFRTGENKLNSWLCFSWNPLLKVWNAWPQGPGVKTLEPGKYGHVLKGSVANNKELTYWKKMDFPVKNYLKSKLFCYFLSCIFQIFWICIFILLYCSCNFIINFQSWLEQHFLSKMVYICILFWTWYPSGPACH